MQTSVWVTSARVVVPDRRQRIKNFAGLRGALRQPAHHPRLPALNVEGAAAYFWIASTRPAPGRGRRNWYPARHLRRMPRYRRGREGSTGARCRAARSTYASSARSACQGAGCRRRSTAGTPSTVSGSSCAGRHHRAAWARASWLTGCTTPYCTAPEPAMRSTIAPGAPPVAPTGAAWMGTPPGDSACFHCVETLKV